MRWSNYFIPTLREDPADAEVISHKLLLRAGLIRQLAAGIYSYLPVAQRSVLKISQIIREEMNAIGGQEFFLPALHPAEPWQESGRWSVMGDNMFRLKDRKGGDYCLGMTHEEIFTEIARRELRSYKQLPQVWYQIQTKFRDELRPKSGLLRVRQFTMKDAYTFDIDASGLDRSFEDQRRAYCRIYDRCGLDYVIVDADTGAMGGSASNEFMVYTDAGEDLVASCAQCGYAANTEKAASRIPEIEDGDATLEPEKFPTPGVRTIEDLTTFPGGAEASRQIKTLVYVAVANKGNDVQATPVLALLRGDHPLNEAKLSNAAARLVNRDGWELTSVRAAHAEEIFEWMGANAGSLGAVGVTKLPVIADEALRGRRNMTTGANEDDHHLRGVNIERDVAVAQWTDLRTVIEGEGCPRCEGTLRVAKALEVGHIFKLGTKYSVSMGASVLTAEGKETPIVMGSYGIGVERILAAAIELHHDEAGIIFPITIAPFHVVVSPLNVRDPELKATADRIYREMLSAGVEVLYDDRDERAGVKLNDADLVGIPFRITIGAKKFKEGKVEFYDRAARRAEDIAVDATFEHTGLRIEQAFKRLNTPKH
ncbi:MAG: proline--tRNA ligase [Acidobacteria bacterium]|nr:proline--tRNA ligase [Acidobacteriota bacterium]MCW5968019.1 proline--tRNA ligase [Blastocatellales bacterium]